jgi:hypothetical protein
MKIKYKNILKCLFPPLVEKRVVNAVHEDDLKKLLEKLGLLEKINVGEATCFFCKENIKVENIEGIFYLDGDIKICCDKIDCYIQLCEIVNEDKI